MLDHPDYFSGREEPIDRDPRAEGQSGGESLVLPPPSRCRLAGRKAPAKIISERGRLLYGRALDCERAKRTHPENLSGAANASFALWRNGPVGLFRPAGPSGRKRRGFETVLVFSRGPPLFFSAFGLMRFRIFAHVY